MAAGELKVILTGTQENTTRQMTMHYSTPSIHSWTAAELVTLSTNWWTSCGTAMRAAAVAACNFNSVRAVYDDGVLPPIEGVYNIPQPQPGTYTGVALPSNCAAVISWKTPYASRKQRGRNYLFGLGNQAAVGSVFTNGALVTFGNAASAILGFFNTIGLTVGLTVYSRTAGSQVFVQTYLIDSIVDTQRRRLPNIGS